MDDDSCTMTHGPCTMSHGAGAARRLRCVGRFSPLLDGAARIQSKGERGNALGEVGLHGQGRHSRASHRLAYGGGSRSAKPEAAHSIWGAGQDADRAALFATRRGEYGNEGDRDKPAAAVGGELGSPEGHDVSIWPGCSVSLSSAAWGTRRGPGVLSGIFMKHRPWTMDHRGQI
jgi:hypothetical protein